MKRRFNKKCTFPEVEASILGLEQEEKEEEKQI